MMTGVLSAFPTGAFFDNAIVELQEIARLPVDIHKEHGKIELPQVHALNCLKDIFTNNRLGPGTDYHIEATLAIAVDCLGHRK